MTLQGAELTLPADVDGDGSTETGVFDLSAGIEISPRVRTGDLIGGSGSQAAAVLNYVTDTDARTGFNLDLGGGATVVDVSFRGFEGSTGQWGDGSGNAAADATGENVFRQVSVLFQYLRTGTFDSRSPATLAWGEYSASGVYDPLDVSPEEPQLTFAADEQTSAFDGTITLVSTQAIADATTPSDQQDDR